MLSVYITNGILVVVLIMAIWIALRISMQSSLHDQVLRLDTRLNENFKHLESLETRLGVMQKQASESQSELREGLIERFEHLKQTVSDNLADGRTQLTRAFGDFRNDLQNQLSGHRLAFEHRQADAARALLEGLQKTMAVVQQQVTDSLSRHSEELGKRVDKMTEATDGRLREISGQVEKRLSEGFVKTTATFADILKRLALIDEAQKKITELSSNVVSLQEVLADKRSRGVFGEVQLAALVRNAMPEANFSLQHTLPNGKIADCVLFLPAPTGTVAIDAKFPLEAFRRMTDLSAGDIERKAAERDFKTDIRKHIKDIAERYIVPGITSDGAVMFIPAESVFAEIQAHHPDLVEDAVNARVWMVSPTTLWAVLNTARAVLKDAATREQVHIIQEHLSYLAEDFKRFQKRMDALAAHIRQAHDDAQQVNTSARKISSRFAKIEQVELEEPRAISTKLEKNEDIS